MIAYFLYHTIGPTTPIIWIINVVIYLIIALILWLIVKWIASEFGVDPKIIKLLGLLLFLVLILSLFVGCSSYESTVATRKIGIEGAYDKTTGGSGDIYDSVTYR